MWKGRRTFRIDQNNKTGIKTCHFVIAWEWRVEYSLLIQRYSLTGNIATTLIFSIGDYKKNQLILKVVEFHCTALHCGISNDFLDAFYHGFCINQPENNLYNFWSKVYYSYVDIFLTEKCWIYKTLWFLMIIFGNSLLIKWSNNRENIKILNYNKINKCLFVAFIHLTWMTK